MKYKKIILLICILTCVLLSMSSVFANDTVNETNYESISDSQELQLSIDANTTVINSNDAAYSSVVYFDASASSDGDGSQSNPYKYYAPERIDYGATAYFADGVYDIKGSNAIYSSSTYKTTFIGQSKENTIFKSHLNNKFDFTVTDNSYFVLRNLTLIGVHINNQANLVAESVVFQYGGTFSYNNQPGLSYSQNSKIYDSTYGGAVICDTPLGKITTLNFNDCTFIGNSASSGGAIATYNSIANIHNCVFYNSSAERFGGAIYSIHSDLTVQDSSFELSSAKYGGAIYANSSSLLLKDSQFLSSQAYSFGGIISSFSSQVDVNNVIFENYSSLTDAGGAIYSIRGTLNVDDSTFKDGFSNFGGAICNLKSNSTISNSEFINNYATNYGGSIYNMYGIFIISSSNFTNSYAGSGGSIFNRLSDSFKLSNNRFKNSTADKGPIVFIDGDKVDVVENNNIHDSSIFLEPGNTYDIDYNTAVPLINYYVEAIDELPSYYDSRKYDYITPAKDQIQGGNCWAFAGIATLEACIKKATGIAYDFSEENVKNLMYEYSLFDSDNGLNYGGNLYMFIAYLASWFGPIYDEYDVYDDYSSLSAIYNSVIHVQNVYVLPERESFFDNDNIKRAVMEYGAVSISIDLSQNEGHAVTIVGWDDEFVSNDFLGNKAVGAWIIKNSWGTSWGYDGFGYLSYQQPINFGYTFIFDDDRGYTNIYQYDFSGKSGTYNLNVPEVCLKNRFTAKNDEILSAVSTYFDEPTNFTVSVILNGKEVTTQNGYAQEGYYTIPLVNEIDLTAGDVFEIVVKIFNDAPVYIPLCTADEINKITFDEDISFYSTDGGITWADLYNSNFPGVACIKAFTRVKALSEISIDVNKSGDGQNPLDKVYVGDLVNIELNLPKDYAVGGSTQSLDGLVIFTINNQTYYATAEGGKACLNFTFDEEGVYDITAQYKSSRVVSNLINFTVNVEKTSKSNLVIDASDISKFYGGSEKYVVTLTEDGQVLSDVNVKISVDGEMDNYKTDSNGQVILDLDYLPVGVHEVSVQYAGKKVSSKFTVLSTINIDDLARDSGAHVSRNFLDVFVSASFLNTDGSILSNQKITFELGQHTFNATTNVVGLATADFNTVYVDGIKSYFLVGTYSVSVTNPVSGEKKQFKLEILPIDSTCSLSVTQLGSVVTFSAAVNPSRASGYVSFIFLGEITKIPIKSGVASLSVPNLDVGEYTVTALYSNDVNLKVSSETKTFKVTENAYKISSSNYWGYYGASGTIARISDVNNTGIQGETVKATILDKTYTEVTDENGQAWFNLDLDVGNYTVLFEYKGQSIYHTIEVRSTISMVDLSGEYLNSKAGATFIYPYSGEKPSSLKVKFIVNGTEYNATTDSNYYSSTFVNLPVGTHTITIVNVINGEEKQAEITIYKTTPKITLTTSKRGDTLLLTADLAQQSAVGNVVFTLGSKKYTTNVKDGKALLALNVLDEGSYEAHANYIGDYNFNNILSSTIKFDYNHTDYALSAPEISKYYGGSESFKVNLTNFDRPVNGAVVSLVLEGKTYNLTTGADGIATFDAKLNPALHVVECSFEDKTVKSAITVESTITFNDGIGDESYSKTTALILDTNGNPVKNTQVTFKIGNQEFKQTTDSNGVATLNPDLDKGTYTVVVINPVNGESKSATLIITKTTPTLTLSFVKENSGEVLKAILPKTATGEVNFVLDDGSEYSSELEDGVSRLEGLDSGEYNVNVTYKGDDNYNPVSKSIKITVAEVADEPLQSILTASKVTTTYGTSKNIVITLKDSRGNVLFGRTITVNLNNKDYKAVWNDNGQATFSVPASLAVKTYTATLTYAGDSEVLGKSIKVSVVVNKATPKLTVAKKTFKLKDKTKKYVVTLKTDKSKVYKNQKITIKVNGKTYSAKTNSKGQATFKLTKLTKKGTFKATVKYAGNSYYKGLSKTVKLTVK